MDSEHVYDSEYVYNLLLYVESQSNDSDSL